MAKGAGRNLPLLPLLHHSISLTLCVNGHVTENLYLAGEAHIRVLFEIVAEPELLLEGERVGVDRG
jgi:hypothetical protein